MNKVGAIYAIDKVNDNGSLIPITGDIINQFSSVLNSHIDLFWNEFVKQFGKQINIDSINRPYFDQFSFDIDFISKVGLAVENYQLTDDQFGILLVDGSYVDQLKPINWFQLLSRYRNRLNFDQIYLICESNPIRGCNKCLTEKCHGFHHYFSKYHIPHEDYFHDYHFDEIFNKDNEHYIASLVAFITYIKILVKVERTRK